MVGEHILSDLNLLNLLRVALRFRIWIIIVNILCAPETKIVLQVMVEVYVYICIYIIYKCQLKSVSCVIQVFDILDSLFFYQLLRKGCWNLQQLCLPNSACGSFLFHMF